MDNQKPNIVLLMMDQQKVNTIKTYGNQLGLSLFQDKMAEKGLLFDNAYANSSICTPSRTSIMTGVAPLVHQVTCHQNRTPWNLDQLPEILKKEGYYNFVCGHYEANRNLDRGWHEQVPQNEPGPLYDSWKQLCTSGRTDIGWSACSIEISPAEGLSARLTDRAIRMLDNARASGAPFFFHMAYNEPHAPYFVPEDYYNMFNAEDIDLPPVGENYNKPEWQYQVIKECGTEKAGEKDIKNVIAAYYAKVAYVNDQMNRLYNAMEERNM